MPATATGKGLAFAVLAIVIFAAQDGLSKYLASHYPPIFIVMLRCWAFALFALALASREKGGVRAALRTKRPFLQIFRGALLSFQIVVAITAFAKVGLAATHSIFASGPLLIAALSMPILGEHVGWRRWAAIGAGFCGVLVILRPEGDMFRPETLYAVAGAAMLAVYAICTRLASRGDRAITSFLYTGLAGAVAITTIGPFHWASLRSEDWGLMGLLCLTGVAGHYFLIRAYELVNAVVVQPITYFHLVLAYIIGIVVFGESVDLWTVVGAAIIVAAGLFTLWRESVAARRERRLAGR